MLASTPVASFHNKAYDPSLSPCRNQQVTTRRASLFDTGSGRSPLRQYPLFPSQAAVEGRSNDDPVPLQSPYRTPIAPAWSPFASNSYFGVEDDDAAVLLESPSASISPLLAASNTRSLFTPVKQASRVVDGLSATPTAETPSRLGSQPTAGTSLKRKSIPTRQYTPLRQHSLTPLDIVSTGPKGSVDGRMFDRLAPLPAPKFPVRTPKTKKDADPLLRHETATMTRLRISESSKSENKSEIGNDSGCDLGCDLEDDKVREDQLFLGDNDLYFGGRGKVGAALRLAGKGRFDEEVAEAISPGGHVIKRRARARPLSDELLGSTMSQVSAMKAPTHDGLSDVTFPIGGSQFRDHTSPSSSSASEAGSPLPRRRASGFHPSRPSAPRRAPLNRVDSATLFFGGPAVTTTSSLISPSSFTRRVTTSISSDAADSPFTNVLRPQILNRHSYSGSGPVPVTPSWGCMQPRSNEASPQTSPPLSYTTGDTENYETDEDDPMMVDPPTNSSFVLNISEGTPSPKQIGRKSEQISTKYPRDSGIVLSDDEDMPFVEQLTSAERLSTMPRASTSVSSLYSDAEDGLVTPGVGPRSSSAWPDAVIIGGSDDGGCDSSEQDVDAFILHTLATAANSTYEAKKVPGTPVKKSKVSYLACQRPWQSAMAHKVGFSAHAEEKRKKAPRKSMPAAYPSLGRKHGRSIVDPSTDSDSDCDSSPSNRKDKYVGLGIGIPSLSKNGGQRNRWLMRRSSSGAFSSSSETSTPTRVRPLGERLRPSGSPHLPIQFSPTNRSTVRSTSGSSSGSVTSPSVLRKLPIAEAHKIRPPRFSERTRRLSQPAHPQRPGRFEEQFAEIAEVGTGEFGKVLKVRTKDGTPDEYFAIKQSKRFEGVKHRLRLREEVDTLQHLSNVSGGLGHPNILAFIDAWEEDDQLFIWTELCEGGNFAHFLWEYGRVFPRLDQARVWKIIVELSNGLKFIHDSGVIHLDLKPANIFLTGEGRFKIGDFGMASLWPRPRLTPDSSSSASGSFEREGDKLYLAPEVLQGKYGKAADMFSFGMTILETASNIVVPDQGEAWHRLRQEDFSQVDLHDSPELLRLVRQMMRTNPALRVGIHGVYNHPVVARARSRMNQAYNTAKRAGTSLFTASPLASVSEDFLPAILNV